METTLIFYIQHKNVAILNIRECLQILVFHFEEIFYEEPWTAPESRGPVSKSNATDKRRILRH